jgi:nicotinamidase-related amidase
VAGNICVLHTAYDAHVRGYSIVIPRDCIASNTVKDQTFALQQFRKVLAIDTRPAEVWWKSFAGRRAAERTG